MKLAAAFVAMLLVACGGGGGGATVVEIPPPDPLPSPPVTANVVIAEPQPEAAMSDRQEWVGKYRCAQGLTDLKLHIVSVRGGLVDAVFEFLHNPSHTEGAFRVRGQLAQDGSLSLVPGEWIRQPPNYVTVGMDGIVNGRAFNGRIDNPSCSEFWLHRVH